MTLLLDAELRLPKNLVYAALMEYREDGVIAMDTAALLIEHGADMHRLEAQVREQADNMEIIIT